MKLALPGDTKHLSKNTPRSYKYLKSQYDGASDDKVDSWLSGQVRAAREIYNWWKERLALCNSTILNLKKGKTAHYSHIYAGADLPFGIYSLQDINEKLYWWRSYYQIVKEAYDEAKHDYKLAQKYLAERLEVVNKASLDSRTVEGKHGYTILVKHESNDYVESFDIRLTRTTKTFTRTEFLELVTKVLADKDSLIKYSWNAYWNLKNIFEFSSNRFVKISIIPTYLSDEKVLIDFDRYEVFTKGGLPDTQRLTYDEYKAKKEAELGESIKGFKSWYADAHRDVLEKQYRGGEAYDIVDCVLKKTYHYWDKFYKMYKEGVETIPRGNHV